jgi:hypothetical protein
MPTVRLDEVTDDRETQTEALCRCVAFLERLEHVREEVGLDASPGIQDRDARAAVGVVEANRDRAAPSVELHRVVQNIAENLVQPDRVPPKGGLSRRDRDLHRNAESLGRGPGCVDHRGDQGRRER